MFAFIFGGISRLFHKWDAVCIDNHVFRLHYRGTVIIFLAAIALVSGYSVMIIMLIFMIIVMVMKAIMIIALDIFLVVIALLKYDH